MTEPRRYSFLFLCTGNSARSILGEYLLRRLAPHRFEPLSAGANPTGEVNPYALRVLEDFYRIDASDARSKSVDEFLDRELDFVITVCDHAQESCPVWPGQPISAHWSLTDPAAVQGTDAERYQAFRRTATLLYRRLELLCSLPIEKLDPQRLQQMAED